MALDVSKIYWALDGKVAPEAIEADLRLRKAVEGLEGQLAVLEAENRALRAENEHLRKCLLSRNC